ncbi:MAG TPA: type II secretion system protein [Longimicrobiaceae bacterium]|nr:type II secretion system protein [Longimicrobiaceae bacterium]
MLPRSRPRHGFTLIELMIVVVIAGILAAIAIPKFLGISHAAKESEAEPILKQVYTLQLRHKQKSDDFASRFMDLEGSAEPVGTARHYDFRITGDASTFTVCATPRSIPELRSFRIDDTRTISVIAPGDCTGSAV